ncbi:lanthionine synthetase LanC family protein [Streptomyces bugieae]|uniref:Lanthionine synthetase LanC family protein n=1 Tax=Streptomyces bugieae TaxID=3098223 RepID=A0ABU7NJ99_9ACTN|nr:lanthionine synthetase LanC family protein [Streptomyces sp. DSM 41528]
MEAAEPADVAVDEVEALTADALRWLLGSAREVGDDGLAWATVPSDDEPDPTLYGGTAGVIPVLLEAWRHFGDDRYGDAALRAARSVAAAVDGREDNSLYFGLTGLAFALRAVDTELGAPDAAAAADRALELVRSRFDGTRWGDWFDLLGGNAGIGLGAWATGDTDLAVLALEPYLRTAEQTPAGVHWEAEAGRVPRFHHLSHGTLGIVYALAGVGRATGRADLVELARAGAADVVARNEAGPADFLVPHSDPQDHPDLTARHSYGWCHGPAGDAQVFRLLRDVLDDPAWQSFADRCWHTVTHSGLPRRLRPGFWDNNGRCCGTAGVLALACDRMAEQDDRPDFARLLVADLVSRATRDADGVRWSNIEHRATPSTLEPHIGYAMGNAGIVRELLRFVRMSRGGDPAYVVAWPDQPVVHRNGSSGRASVPLSGFQPRDRGLSVKP